MSEWKEKILDELVDVDPEQLSLSTDADYSFFYIDISSVSPGKINYPVHQIMFKGSPSRARKILKVNDILMSTVRPNLKAFAQFKRKSRLNFIASTGFAILRAKPHTDIDFIYQSLFSNEIERQIETVVVGSNYPAINSSDVKKLKINTPSLPAQRHIAHILSTCDVVIEKTQAAIDKYKAIKQGMLHDLFTRGIDSTTGKLRPKYQDAPQLYKESKLGMVPKEWEIKKLGEYSFITKLAGFEYTIHFDYSKSGPIIAVRALNIKHGKLDLENIHTIPKETSDSLPRSQLKKGDLVISYVGTVGEVAVIPENNKFHLAPNVAKISVNINEIDPFYLNQFLNADVGQNEIIKLIPESCTP